MSEAVDPTTFRVIMRRVPSPVVVVTVAAGSKMRGITIGSFTSVALEPPLISFNVTCDAATHDLLDEADRFAVHVLGEGQAYLAKHFAVPDLSGAEQFESVPHQRDAHGTPILDGVSAVLHCVPHEQFAVADHSIFIGRVTGVEERPDDGAVLYYQRSYRGVGSELRSSLLSPVKSASNESS